MRVKNITIGFLGFIPLFAACLMSQSWNLPQGTAAKENGPRTYRFTVDYYTSDTKGRIIQRQQVKGDYTRGLPGGKAVWKNTTVTEPANGDEGLGPAREREFMNGFQYQRNSFDPMSPDFFKGFPPAAVMERNLIWDTTMLEFFGQEQFKHLKLNHIYHLSTDQDVGMPGIGVFHNRDVQLMWTGRSHRNGQDCALIEYQAYFNPLELVIEGMNLKGRSHFWGQIWVSLATRQIEYGTLYEDVLGEIKLPGTGATQVTNAFRYGIFEPLAKE
jgi:hypothetical protein